MLTSGTMHSSNFKTLLTIMAASSLSGCSGDDADGGRDAEPDVDVESDAEADASDAALDAEVDGDEEAPVPDPYSEALFEEVWISSQTEDEHFQSADASFELHDGPFESVTLVVDLESPCYPFEGWADDPPPVGENWPQSCDAFDRNFEFTLDEPATEDAPPALELVRAITPFGGPLHLDIDVTDVFNGLPGPHSIRTHISTWSDASGEVSGSAGGWTVSARLDVVPGDPPRTVLAVIPLLNGWARFDTSFEDLPFDVPDAASGGRIEYRVTGHGGVMTGESVCVGPAEEFCRRTHHVMLDGEELETLEPWRTCAELCTAAAYEPWDLDYCLENPCGAVSSVRAPRANWCPGAVTEPFVWEPPELAEQGEHTFRYEIEDIADGGSWRVSTAVFLYGD